VISRNVALRCSGGHSDSKAARAGVSVSANAGLPGIKLLLRVRVKECGSQLVDQRVEILKARSCIELVSRG
jgi:hypothetical protein